jgi:ubiquinone/menaquinone biosynthesis C-methylase UbiE
VAPILANSAKQIIVADPVFREPNFHALFQEDIRRIERLIESSSAYTADISDSIRLLRAKNHQEQKQVQNELLWWNEYQPKGIHSHIQRNASYGEKLEGIIDNSMDVIFLNYVVSKKTVDIAGVVKEITRVLKKDGYVIVSDNDMSQDLYDQLL